MAQQWHYTSGGAQFGPVSAVELKQLASSGRLTPIDLVWKEGLSNWVSAKKVKGLFNLSPAGSAPQSLPPLPSPTNSITSDAVQAGSRNNKSAFSDADVQSLAVCANRLADVINESMRLAKESRKQDTKLSRLRVAKQKLEQLKELAAAYPFLELTTLAKVETCIARMEIEFEQAEENVRLQERLCKLATETIPESLMAPKLTAPTNSIGVLAPRIVRSRPASRARPVSFENLPYIRLPKAPIAWEERYRVQSETILDATSVGARDTQAKGSRNTLPRFNVSGEGWAMGMEATLPRNERPDPAFRQMFPTAGSTLWLDPKGRRAGFLSAPAVALTTDRTGAWRAERGLKYDVYRADVNSNGSGMVFLSRDGILHGYSETLESIISERVEDLPEYVAQAKRFGIEPRQLKNHARCVALSTDRSRHLITVVDEAWCYDVTTGHPIWGLQFPAKEGWTEIAAERSARVGASAEINAALRLMELTYPLTPEAITQRYRALAMRWHPDRNPGNPESTRRFQELGAAMELLTGVDVSHLSSSETERVSYQQVLHRSSALTITMHVGGAFGADWIYAANFAHKSHSTFLAGYSGNVVEVDASGLPLRVYDIGAVPRHVAQTPSHLYILTDTRVYVLCGNQLAALVDVFEKGKLIVGDTGFGLLQPKQFQWFNPTGQLLGKVQTRDPIRRTYTGPAGLVVETRTHRGIITGAPSWW